MTRPTGRGRPCPHHDPRGPGAPAERARRSTPAGLEGRVRRGAMWSGFSSLAVKVGNIAVMVVVVRLVTPTEFGVFAASLTVALILGSFADWGVSAFLSRAAVDPEKVAPTVAFVAVVSSCGLAGLTLVGAPFLAGLFSAPEAAGPIRVMALCLVVGGFTAVPTALLTREFRQDRLFLAHAIAFVPSNLVLVWLASEGMGAMAFAWSRVVAVVCYGLVVAWAVDRWYWPSLDRACLGQTLAFGLPLAAANLVNYTLLHADYALVGHQLGPVLLGTYALAFGVASWSTSMLSAAINGVAMPGFSRVGHDRALLERALARSTRAVCLLALPVATLTLALAEPLVLTLYGDRWRAAIPVLEILGLYGAMFVIVSLLSNLLVGLGRTRQVLLIQLAWIGTLAPAMLLGVHLDGVRGVAWAHVVVVLAVVLPAYVWTVSRHTSRVVRVILAAAGPPLAACLAAVAAVLLVRSRVDGPVLELLSGAAAGGLVYLLGAGRMLRDLAGMTRGVPDVG